MGKPSSGKELELEEHMGHHEAAWRIKRVAWTCMCAVIIAALAGLLGPGPASKARAGEEGSQLSVEYYRFARYQAQTELKIHYKAPGAEQVELWLDRRFVERMHLEGWEPSMEKSVISDDRVHFIFLQKTNAPSGEVVLRFEPNAFWKNEGKLGLSGGPSVEIKQLYFP